MSVFLTTDGLLTLFTLTLLEIVLGIDNIIFISIVSSKLPAASQKSARQIGLTIALLARIMLLTTIKYIMSLNLDIVTILGKHFSGRDIILIGGGLFLLVKTVLEIIEKMDASSYKAEEAKAKIGYLSVIIQIILIDIVFSFDSILTAVGLANDLPIMIAAVIISMIIMFVFATPISNYINSRPTVKMLALSFLILVGGLLTLEGFGIHVDKSYIYFAMGFSLIVEALNRRLLKQNAHITNPLEMLGMPAAKARQLTIKYLEGTVKSKPESHS